VQKPYDQPLRDLTAGWTAEDLANTVPKLGSFEEARDLTRAFLATRSREWLFAVYGERLLGDLDTPAHRALFEAIGAVSAYVLGRETKATALEQPRGFGKSTTSGLLAFKRAMYAMELGIACFYRIQPDVLEASQRLRVLVPWDGGDLDAYLETPMGKLYPEARRSGPMGRWWLNTWYGRTPFWFRGFGGTLRGLLAEDRRPTFLLLDDLDTDEAARSARRREDNARKLAGAVRGLGPSGGGTTTVLLGTRVSDDGMTARAHKDPAWKAERLSIWIQRPARTDLWEKCRSIWADLRLIGPDARVQAARAFYEENQEAMDEGAITLDPVRWPPFACYLEEWALGPRAFAQEYENKIIDSADRLLPMERARSAVRRGNRIYWIDDKDPENPVEREVQLADCECAIWLDPRYSENLIKNDYAAAVLVARDPDGYVYEVETRMERCGFREQRQLVWDLVDLLATTGFTSLRVGYESNSGAAGWAELWEQERRKRIKEGLLAPKVHAIVSHGDKKIRIGSLDAAIFHGHLLFCHIDAVVRGQWVELPSSKHDDAPDATERAVALLDMADLEEDSGMLALMEGAGDIGDW
jgi:hypothetical protein